MNQQKPKNKATDKAENRRKRKNQAVSVICLVLIAAMLVTSFIGLIQ